MAVARRTVTIGHLAATGIWWIAAAAGGAVIANDDVSFVARIAVAFLLWISVLALPGLIAMRSRRLDEMQQRLLWQAVAVGGLFIVSYLTAMAAYFTLTSNYGATALMVMAAQAGPMAVMVGGLMTLIMERNLEAQA